MTSVGQLRQMSPDMRALEISKFDIGGRMKLAHLASLGVQRRLDRHIEHAEKGHSAWAASALMEAVSYSELLVELTEAVSDGC